MKNHDYVHILAGFVFCTLFFFTGTPFVLGCIYLFAFTLYIEGMQWALYDHKPKLFDRLFDILGYMAGGLLAAWFYTGFRYIFSLLLPVPVYYVLYGCSGLD